MTTGEIVSVEGTDMDFRTPTAVGARIDNDFEQLKNGKGYDHNCTQYEGAMSPARVPPSNLPQRVLCLMSIPTNRAFRFMPVTSWMAH